MSRYLNYNVLVLIVILAIIALISCENKEKQIPEYNARAIELNNKASIFLQNFKEDSALILYDEAIKIDKSYYLPHSNKATIYLRMKKYAKALYESEMVIEKRADLAEGWFFAGLLNEHQGNSEKAFAYYRKSIQIFSKRIENAESEEVMNMNKLNLALSKKFIGDDSYIEDLEELEKNESYKLFASSFRNQTRQEIMDELIK